MGVHALQSVDTLGLYDTIRVYVSSCGEPYFFHHGPDRLRKPRQRLLAEADRVLLVAAFRVGRALLCA